MRRTRVLVVDDDAVYRRIVARTLESIPHVEAVGSAPNLSLARDKIARGGIDAVTIDVVLRDESGLELLSWIHAHHPALITVLLTAGEGRAACRAVDATLLGASALVLKPTGEGAQEALRKALSGVIPAPRSGSEEVPAARPSQVVPAVEHVLPAARELVAIGASTGGPPVVVKVLKDLPAAFDVPVALVQHMPAAHMSYYAELLARESGRRVRLATEGAPVEAGTVHVACGGRHLAVVRDGGRLVLHLDDGPAEHCCKPAVDPLFRSVARACGAAAIGVVLTGMGSDGAAGALAMRCAGAPIIAQDAATSVVWGMPGAVVRAGAADVVLPAAQVGARIASWTARRRS